MPIITRTSACDERYSPEAKYNANNAVPETTWIETMKKISSTQPRRINSDALVHPKSSKVNAEPTTSESVATQDSLMVEKQGLKDWKSKFMAASTERETQHRGATAGGVSVYAIRATGNSVPQKVEVPDVGDIEAAKVGLKSGAEIAAALKRALLSGNPATVKKAADAMRTIESYQRKASEDKINYAGTKYWAMEFPQVELKLNPEETASVLKAVIDTQDEQTVGSMILAASSGIVESSPPNAFTNHAAMQALWPEGRSAILPGSQGTESPNRDNHSFQEEYAKDAAPGESTIRDVIRKTAVRTGGTCPFARGNHAKGKSFGDGEFKVSEEAPQWAKDLIGSDPKSGAMLRISTSHTSPEDHDSSPAQTGLRLVIPILGEPGQPNSSTWDVTANTGSTTHRPNAREHTEFTNDFSVPAEAGILSDVAGSTPVRAGAHLVEGVLQGEALDRIKGIRAALGPTQEAMSKPLDEQELFGRHTLFMGGRYVQIRYKVVDPHDFRVPDESEKNGQLDSKEEAIERGGLKINIYLKELPPGADPKLVEKEGWTDDDLPEGMKFEERLLGQTTFKPQKSDPSSKASAFFDEFAHIPGRQGSIARGAGEIGRQRSQIYWESQQMRHKQRSPENDKLES